MSHPLPPHECMGEGVGLARGRGGVETPPERSLCCMLLVLTGRVELEDKDANGPPLSIDFGRPSEEDTGAPKNLR